MLQHKLSTYKDDVKYIPYCTVCSLEYPQGECSGKFVEKDKKANDELDKGKS